MPKEPRHGHRFTPEHGETAIHSGASPNYTETWTTEKLTRNHLKAAAGPVILDRQERRYDMGRMRIAVRGTLAGTPTKTAWGSDSSEWAGFLVSRSAVEEFVSGKGRLTQEAIIKFLTDNDVMIDDIPYKEVDALAFGYRQENKYHHIREKTGH